MPARCTQQEMLYEGLVNITTNGFEGCLAESWDVSEDGKVYTFHIRPGVLFSDGEKCDAYASRPTLTQFWKTRTATPGWR